MGDFKGPTFVEELVALWRLATASERVRFLSWIATAPDCQRSRLPADAGPLPVVRLDSEGER